MINALFTTYSLAYLLMLVWLFRMILSDSPPGAPIGNGGEAIPQAGLTLTSWRLSRARQEKSG